ncbi:MAG: sialate O-acetylesterase [Chlorobi bacterium]|nr:sialate O-acetylesterase [Chlorobiota bacterium]
MLFLGLMLSVVFSVSSQAQGKKSEPDFSTYYYQRKSLFDVLPDRPGEIVFLGNSITDGGEWAELFGNSKIVNRGISGDITPGVLYRLGEVTRAKPSKVFLMIGVNDLARGVSPDSVVTNIRTIITNIRRDSPSTQIYLQSVLPVNPAFTIFKNHVNKTGQIREVNARLKKLGSEKQVMYIDLFSSFSTADGYLNPDYSNDGLHLTGKGYLLWKSIIEKFL